MAKAFTAGINSFFVCANCGGEILPGQQYKLCGSKKIHLKPRCTRAVAKHSHKSMRLGEWYQPRQFPKSGDRCLRSYSRECAEKEYYCYRCGHDSAFRYHRYLEIIFSADPYEAEVWVIRGKLEVRRFHRNCPSPPYPEEEENLEQEYEDGYQEEEFPIAV